MTRGIVREETVQLFKSLCRRRLAFFALAFFIVLVIPYEVLEAVISGQGGIRVELLQTFTELVIKPGIGPAVAGCVGRLVMKLQQALRVGVCAFDFRDLRRREVKDFRLDVRNLDRAVLYLRRTLPEIS